jgi:hypothetical protein
MTIKKRLFTEYLNWREQETQPNMKHVSSRHTSKSESDHHLMKVVLIKFDQTNYTDVGWTHDSYRKIIYQFTFVFNYLSLLTIIILHTYRKLYTKYIWYDSVACFPHAGTVEMQKPRNTHATTEVRVFIARCWVTPRSLLCNAEVNTSLRLVAMQQ